MLCHRCYPVRNNMSMSGFARCKTRVQLRMSMKHKCIWVYQEASAGRNLYI